MDKGQVWTFSMDKQSLENLEKLNMSPYFGFGRLKFRKKVEKRPEGGVENDAKAPEASTSKVAEATTTEDEGEEDAVGPSTGSGTSPLKRQTVYQQKDTAMEEEEALLSSPPPSPTK